VDVKLVKEAERLKTLKVRVRNFIYSRIDTIVNSKHEELMRVRELYKELSPPSTNEMEELIHGIAGEMSNKLIKIPLQKPYLNSEYLVIRPNGGIFYHRKKHRAPIFYDDGAGRSMMSSENERVRALGFYIHRLSCLYEGLRALYHSFESPPYYAGPDYHGIEMIEYLSTIDEEKERLEEALREKDRIEREIEKLRGEMLEKFSEEASMYSLRRKKNG